MTEGIAKRDPAVQKVTFAEIQRTIEVEREVAEQILQVVESTEIACQQDYDDAGAVLQRVKKQIKRVNGARDSIVKPVKDGIAYIDSMFKPLAQRLIAEGEDVLKKRIIKWHQEQDEIRRKNEAEARRLATDRQAELDQEAIVKAEAARKSGDETKAAEIEASVPVAAVPILSEETTKPKGIGLTENWKWELVDGMKVPPEYWILNEKMIGATVRAQKEKTNIPGIRAYAEKGVSARSG